MGVQSVVFVCILHYQKERDAIGWADHGQIEPTGHWLIQTEKYKDTLINWNLVSIKGWMFQEPWKPWMDSCVS